MAGDRYERSLKPPRHVFDEARLAAAGRSLEHDRQPTCVAHGEDLHLVACGHIVRGVVAREADAAMDCRFFHVS